MRVTRSGAQPRPRNRLSNLLLGHTLLSARQGLQDLLESPVRNAAALTARLFVREPEVNPLQDPHLDHFLRSFREAVILPWVHGQAR